MVEEQCGFRNGRSCMDPIFKVQKIMEKRKVHNLPLFLLFILTYLLTPWSRVLLEKLTGSAASQEIPRVFGTRRFITVPTSARHLSLWIRLTNVLVDARANIKQQT